MTKFKPLLWTLMAFGLLPAAAAETLERDASAPQHQTAAAKPQAGALPAAQQQALSLALEHTVNKRFEQALNILNPLIGETERLRRQDSRTAYATYPEPALAMLYLTQAAHKRQAAYLLGHEWVEPLILRSYIRIEQGDMAAAKRDLDEALKLAPFDPHILNERGYLFAKEQNWNAAEADFREAEKTAALFQKRRADGIALQTRALRGLGYIAVERHQWQQAEQFYRQALKIDPKDRKSLAELEYIRQHRNRP